MAELASGLHQLSDEELVAYLQEDFESRFQQVREVLWLRYAYAVEHRIRAVLDYHGVSYHADREYYNKIHFHILDRLWERESFRQNLAKFDRAKGGLRNWLLAFQVVNTVRDWLKCREADERQSRLEAITSRKNVETVLDQGVENLPDPHPNGAPGVEEEVLRPWLAGLPLRDQALLSLLYLAYGMPPAEVMAWLAELHACKAPMMEQKLAARMQELRDGARFARHDETLARLGVAGDRAQWFEHLVRTTREEYFRLGGGWQELEAREEEARAAKLGELDQRLRDGRELRMSPREQCLRRYAAYYRRAQKWSQKRREFRELLVSSRVFVTLPFPELSRLLQIPEKTLRNRLTVLKKLLE